jgi:uncharacterized protein (DUF302 family)
MPQASATSKVTGKMSYYFSRTLDASFDDAVARTRAALVRNGFGVLTEIDVAATLKAKVGADMAPYRILGACSPRHAHRALQAEPLIGTMLPCNVIVREISPGRTDVAAVDPVASMQAITNPDLAGVASEVQALLRDTIAQL